MTDEQGRSQPFWTDQ